MRRRLACGCVVPLLFLAVLLGAVYGLGGRVARNVIASVTGGAVQLGALHFTPTIRASVRDGDFAWHSVSRNVVKSCLPTSRCAAACIASVSR